tara:strand:+ start:1222 stop:3219 length:1998 start_codon:yes stop_codon:yes gene_type:complete
MKKKILVRGPALSQTGYGEQCRFALRSLRSRPDLFDVYLMNIPWGGTNWIFDDNEERRWIDELIIKTKPLIEQQKSNKQVPLFDVSLQVTIPNELQLMAPQNILYTAGIETDKACTEWIAKCHQFADRILVISEHAKSGLKTEIEAEDHTGNTVKFCLEKPIHVVHYPVKNIETEDINLDLKTDFNFITMAQWGPRKNLPNTVAWFCQEFCDDENVGLIVKTFSRGNSQIDKLHTSSLLKQVANNYPDRKCKIYFLHGYMNEKQIHSLYVHPKIKAMINFGHGEGFGLPLFEAAYSGLPVITHDFGGQKDFLYAPKKDKKGKKKLRPHFSKVNYDLNTVQKEVLWKGVIEPDMRWAYPNQASCKAAMREAVNNPGLLQGIAKKLQKWLHEEFEEKKRYNNFAEKAYGEKIFSYDSVNIDEVPKISFITSVYKGGEYFEEFMKDITSQTIFENKCELILVDCNSPDNESELVKPWIEKYPKNIKYIELNEDPGIYAAWNLAIKESTGDFISNANLDDRKSPYFAEKLAKYLHAHPQFDCVYTENYMTFKSNETFENNTSNGAIYPAEEFTNGAMLRGNPPHCMPMWRKSLHEKNEWFDEEYRSAADWDFWLRCAHNGSEYKKIGEPLGLYYFNPTGISTNQENRSWKIEEEKQIYQKYIKLHKEKQ